MSLTLSRNLSITLFASLAYPPGCHLWIAPTLWTSYVTPAAAALPAGVHVPRHPAPPRLHERLRAAPPRANTLHHWNTHQGRVSTRLEIYFNLHCLQTKWRKFAPFTESRMRVSRNLGLYLSTHQYMYRPHNTGQFPLVEQFINICCLWLELNSIGVSSRTMSLNCVPDFSR